MFFGIKLISKEYPLDYSIVCQICGYNSSHFIKVNYIYFHFGFMLRFVISSEFFILCNTCTGEEEIDLKLAKEIIGKNPISFYDKYSLAIAILIIAFIGKLSELKII